MKQALYVDSISSVTGSFIGTSSVTAYIESSSGVSVGGRTGLTAVVVVCCSCWLSSCRRWRDGARLRCSWCADLRWRVDDLSLARVNWQDLTESVPAFITAVMCSTLDY